MMVGDEYMVESKGGAIACMMLSLLCLGTWPALMAVLERRGRLPQHTYLDYSITNFLAAIFIALLFGGIGGSTPDDAPSFITQLTQVRVSKDSHSHVPYSDGFINLPPAAAAATDSG